MDYLSSPREVDDQRRPIDHRVADMIGYDENKPGASARVEQFHGFIINSRCVFDVFCIVSWFSFSPFLFIS